MLDQDTLRPVIISMILYILLSVSIPNYVTKPTGIRLIDDIITYLITQKGNIASGTILVGVVILASNHISDKFL